MKNLLLVSIILLSGLLVTQFLMGGKRDSAVQQTVQREVVQPETQKRAVVRRVEQHKAKSPAKTAARPGRVQIDEAELARYSGGMEVADYNATLVGGYDIRGAYNQDIDQAQESSVSQTQIDIFQKREAAVQRRDEMLQVRAATISALAMKNNTDQQSIQ